MTTPDNVVSIEAHERLGGPQTMSTIGALNRERQTAQERAEIAEGWRDHWRAKAAIANGSVDYWRGEHAAICATQRRWEAAAVFFFVVDIALLLAVLLLALAFVRIGG